ncbi:hypothetical protein DPMN_014979 [Dreissena polymorpha]|uniref:Uncharacterized protein n=1 Tax=Dreissena polymorpha TaxID=45954 RepID=A0A9D4NBU7_DREPO|nr:hypothetical protein DPMN_014979 [Dreissena polymorpha]
MMSSFCAALTFSSLPCQAFNTLAWRARPYENVRAQGLRPLNALIALKLMDASSSD